MQGIALAGDDLLAEVVVQHAPFHQGLQVPRSLPVLRQELQRDQDLGDVVQGGAVGIGSHRLPARRNGLDGGRLFRCMEIANARDERLAILNFTGLNLPGEGADEFQQDRKLIFEARDGRCHWRHFLQSPKVRRRDEVLRFGRRGPSRDSIGAAHRTRFASSHDSGQVRRAAFMRSSG